MLISFLYSFLIIFFLLLTFYRYSDYNISILFFEVDLYGSCKSDKADNV